MTEFDGLPTLQSPIAIAAFEGWNDAADASTSAVEHLEQLWDAREISSIDPEEFYDFQVNRPQITLTDGDTRHIEWPGTTILSASPPGAKHDVVLIRGTEPSMRWRTFCESVLEICHSLGVQRLVLLGALLADVPYNRPLPVSGSVTRPDEHALVTPTRYEGPTGIVGVLHDAARRAELDAMSFWVHVPHYANNPPCPKATLALLHRIEDVLDLPVPVADLAEEAAAWEERVRNAASQDAELAEYLRELEERAGDAGIQPLTGDEIASAFERYLRRRGHNR
ncbi:PAC2 family protein [Allorhizocola rhizosphaerae]|uniref:PAC2 family protein n=1 Tax=Allorhizocola rhizosphaerae TaxID=1872709 RepID=UPI000E3DDB65|nr:PAC2 family protein [Allorhizocola rhizosphaerae]